MTTPTPIHYQAQLAISALHIRKTCGRFAASQFASNSGIRSLYTKVQQLEAVKGV